MKQKNHHSISLTLLCFATVFVLSLVARVVFLAKLQEALPVSNLPKALALGFVFDFVVGAYFSLPFALLGFLPERTWQKGWFQKTTHGLFFVILSTLTLLTISEGFFVDEFHSRFNFIAVDYLVYTNEVIKNIFESYPMGWILPILLVSLILVARFILSICKPTRPTTYRARAFVSLATIAAAVLAIFYFNETRFLDDLPTLQADTAKNPAHALFAAYLNNEIDFKRFYSTMDPLRATKIVHEALEADFPKLQDSENPSQEDESSIVRNIVNPAAPKNLNVVIVLMESMSARFMHSYGAEKIITPNLDALAHDGLFFDHVYSTGTRTVRGIEAVVLSIPPTPGQSIVRRPDSDHLSNIGTIFRNHGYETEFIYGGHAFFDNMGPFFASNGFEVYDQADIGKNKIQFASAWGACDEDILNYSLLNADKSAAQKRPFFQFILTTSNHRPYTYPDGKIDLPSGSGRDGAVKYSDFAIGEYIKAAKTKAWFKDTVFIFVADHNASVAGGSKILPADYRIPLIFYAPDHIKPLTSSIVGSQIDLAPTLFGLLNFSYQTKFFGHDLTRAHSERAFLATYQKVGLLQNQKLVMLSPNRRIEIQQMAGEEPKSIQEVVTMPNQTFVDHEVENAVAFYQAASDLFSSRLLKESENWSTRVNIRSF